jgi:hypothetical protein
VKKAFRFIMFLMALSPLIAEAVTWSVDSSPFLFPTNAVIKNVQSRASQLILKTSFSAARGLVLFRLNLPSLEKSAKLNIFNHYGVKVKSFDVGYGSSVVQWNVSRTNVAAGIYLASLRCGGIEKTTQISIVK